MEQTFGEAGSTDIAIMERSNTLIVSSREELLAAGILRNELKAKRDEWVAKYERLLERTKAAYDEVRNAKKVACEPYELAIEVVSAKMNAYATRLENERRAEQAKAEAVARAAAEAERQKLLERAASAKTESKQDELLERAENVYIEPVQVERKIEKMIKTEECTITQRQGLEVCLTDMTLLCAEIASGKCPANVVKISQQNVNAWVKAMGIKQCPGLVIRNKTIVV